LSEKNRWSSDVRGTNGLYERQPESRAAILTGASLIDPKETIENMRQHGWWYANSRVTTNDGALQGGQVDRDAAVFGQTPRTIRMW
jgi:hypothetical protein